MEIAYLCDHPRLVPALAQAHVDAFGAHLPDWTVEQAGAELAAHARRHAIPTTLLALRDDDWLGSVSLLHDDHQHIPQYSPWLASLYVRPEARGQGAGATLVRACVQEAAALGIAVLYLYCVPALVSFYRALGWREHDCHILGPLQIVVMACDTALTSTGAEHANRQ